MRLQLACVAAFLLTPSFAQTLIREYRVPFAVADAQVGTTAATAFAGGFQFPLPSVTEGPLVEVIQVGFLAQGTRRIEWDYTNSAAGPITVDVGIVEPNFFASIGTIGMCQVGIDGCFNGCPGGSPRPSFRRARR